MTPDHDYDPIQSLRDIANYRGGTESGEQAAESLMVKAADLRALLRDRDTQQLRADMRDDFLPFMAAELDRFPCLPAP
jgi:hypothetical protein